MANAIEKPGSGGGWKLRGKHGVRGKFYGLLVGQLILLLVYPYFEGYERGQAVLGFAFSLILISAVYAVSGNRRNLVIAVILGLPAFASQWARLFAREAPMLQKALLLTALPFYLFVTGTLLVHVLKSKRITVDTLCGAVSVYLLLGLTWMVAYAVLDTVQPGSLAGNLITGVDGKPVLTNYLYYSYVTLTTLGYGDIVPATSQARSLARLRL